MFWVQARDEVLVTRLQYKVKMYSKVCIGYQVSPGVVSLMRTKKIAPDGVE